ncbi:MAG TPA: helix-turn-helix domain-containing protein, partial [Candidatus Saccharimonadales bacterium]|nr:helix-turn-helix domain-containing protein [Candidatus Saccharimonadales bacterium]
ALLEYLLHRQGQVITKDMIISHVWDEDALILPNTVEVYIGYLRSKIDRPFPQKPALLQTIRGFGYSLRLNETPKKK